MKLELMYGLCVQGLSTLGLAAVQAGMGVVVYLVPRLAPARRAAFYQYHAALGGATFTLAITTMLAGLQVQHLSVHCLAVRQEIPKQHHHSTDEVPPHVLAVALGLQELLVPVLAYR